ncbi:hypothetical protein FoTM2_009992 [Fusarium oxysporum f. sp. vasinfectum]|uniref:Uncharacterized protein n=1 Tax=Fusarium oxysporum f. sp. vasinfectum 25433 TaxID=1089449 RepID=X0NSB7_FUSOX|nr:hypothetical protein FOTG_01867 [Fusarium oxysporum f. sp. vasinfectum 25433]KAK2929652.1 hypothetical protein FoTM2_009992 [Fusarium oxysporum f. sp. vasinfectum]
MAVELESSDALVIKPVLCITITFISVIPKFFGVLKAKPSDPLCVSLPSTQHLTLQLSIGRFRGLPPFPRGHPTGRFLNTACTAP